MGGVAAPAAWSTAWGGPEVSHLHPALCNHQPIPRSQWCEGRTLLTCVPSWPTQGTLTVRLGKDTGHTNTRSGNQKYTLNWCYVYFPAFFVKN